MITTFKKDKVQIQRCMNNLGMHNILSHLTLTLLHTMTPDPWFEVLLNEYL